MKVKSSSRLLIKAMIITVAIIGIIAIFFMLLNKIFPEGIYDEYIAKDYIVIDDENYLENEDIELVLITGLDSFEVEIDEGYMNDDLADFLYLLVVDKKDKSITPIHINRDSMVYYQILGPRGDIVDYAYGQIALSHTYGDGGLDSLCNVKDAVSNLFMGIHIDYYLSMTMDAIPIINDSLGGVEVFVEDDFSKVDEKIIQGQNCLLLGDSSLHFVRARGEMEDSTNLARMKRQRVYLDAAYRKFKDTAINDDNYIKNVLNDINPYLISSANINDLQVLFNFVKDYKLNEIEVLQGEAKKGEKYIEYYIDDNSIKTLSIKYLLEKD